MPFTAPAGYASKATTGYQTTFAIGSSASPPTYSVVSEVKSIKCNLADVPQVSTSHLLSVLNTEEFIPGMIKPGTIEISGNFIADTAQLTFNTLMQSQAFFPFEIIGNVQRGKTYTLTGFGYVSKYENGPFENNKTIEYSLSIQISGFLTETVTS